MAALDSGVVGQTTLHTPFYLVVVIRWAPVVFMLPWKLLTSYVMASPLWCLMTHSWGFSLFPVVICVIISLSSTYVVLWRLIVWLIVPRCLQGWCRWPRRLSVPSIAMFIPPIFITQRFWSAYLLLWVSTVSKVFNNW